MMDKDNNPLHVSSKRQKRVANLKKIIILLFVSMLITPIILCIVLFHEIKLLNVQVESLQSAVEELIVSAEEKKLETAIDSEVIAAGLDQTTQDTKEIKLDEESQETIYEGYRKVYLTFDDGPSVYTEEILEILKDYNVKATFFVLGKTGEENEALYKKIVEEGHSIGLHSYSHQYDVIYSSLDEYQKDLIRLEEYVFDITGVQSKLVRFPGGSSNTVSDVPMQVFIDFLSENDYTYFDWNISSGDAATKVLTAEEIVDNATENLESMQQAVILLHDSGNRATTVEALPVLVEKILGMEHTVLLPITDQTIPIQHIKSKEE